MMDDGDDDGDYVFYLTFYNRVISILTTLLARNLSHILPETTLDYPQAEEEDKLPDKGLVQTLEIFLRKQTVGTYQVSPSQQERMVLQPGFWCNH